MAKERRFPNAVYGVGTEPDARFSLANERTFLAWIRTSLALLAAGVAIQALDLPVSDALGTTASLIFLVLGLLVPVQGWFGWMRAERALRQSRPLPVPMLSGPLAVGVLLAGVLLLIGLFVP